MKVRHRPTEEERREEMRDRLRYFVFKARRNPKSLTLSELDELCEIVVKLAPRRQSSSDPT